jgi:hypothetical protein
MSDRSPQFVIVDYNLTRVDDVRHIRDHVHHTYGCGVLLVRANPTETDHEIADEVIDLDPLSPDFVKAGVRLLEPRRDRLRAGIVFSDNAVHSGAVLLHRLGLRVDSPELAFGAFCKLDYRLSEARHGEVLAAQRLMIPDFKQIRSIADLRAFAERQPGGFVVKPTREGNNRGVVVVRPGNDLVAAFAEVEPYLDGGVIGEQIIPFRREFSVDGLGSLAFVTEKVSASGRYPVEVAQVLPARLGEREHAVLLRAGMQANWLVGQYDGPFHNEIKLSDDGTRAAVVEPNRRPAGMKIWSLAHWVYGVDFYQRWVDTAFGTAADLRLPEPTCAAATVMLGVSGDRVFGPEDVDPAADPFGEAVARTARRHGLAPDQLAVKHFAWLSAQRREVRAVPRDNADFAASGCVVLSDTGTDIRDVVHTLREVWLEVLDRCSRGLALVV